MSETVVVALIGLAGVIVGGAVMWFVALRKMPQEIKVLDSEEAVNLSEALNNATDALIKRTTAGDAERKDFEQRISGLESRQMERNRQFYAMEQELQALKQYIEARERAWAQELSSIKHNWRDWYTRLKKWLDDQALTGYPEPPADLLDTGEHKAVDK